MKIAKKLVKHKDQRGWLAEILKANEIKEPMQHIFFSVTKPGMTRGNHYHKRKVEWFCVIRGKAKLILKDNRTKKRIELVLKGENPTTVKILPGISHAIQNIGDEDMYLVSITNEVFDPSDPDTFRSPVSKDDHME